MFTGISKPRALFLAAALALLAGGVYGVTTFTNWTQVATAGNHSQPSCSTLEITALPYESSGAAWSDADCSSKQRENGRADYYTFAVDDLQQVAIDLTATAGGALYLTEGNNGQGKLVASTDSEGSPDGKATMRQNLLPGTYTVEAAALSAGQTGAYALTIATVNTVPRPHASIVPDPTTFKFKPNGKWNTFNVSANVPVKVIANPSGAAQRMEIAPDLPSRTFCPPEPNDDAARSNGHKLYLSSCAPGTAVIEVRNANDDSMLAKYTVEVKGPNAGAYGVLSPNPSKAAFKPNGKWKAFKVASDVDLEVEANPKGSTPILELTSSAKSGNHCGDGTETGDDVDASDGDTVYLAACKAGDGVVNIYRKHDRKLLASYVVKVTAAPSSFKTTLQPDPNLAGIKADGEWHSFKVVSDADVEIVVNPRGNTPIMEITSTSGASNHCTNGAEIEDDIDASNGDTIYLAACRQGTGTVNIYRKSDDALLLTYSITIAAADYGVCKPVTNVYAYPLAHGTVKLTWDNPTGGLRPTKRVAYIWKWDADQSTWKSFTYITEPPSSTSLLHIGPTWSDSHAYHVVSYCERHSVSLPSKWSVVGTQPFDQSRSKRKAETPIPTPTPTPTATPDPPITFNTEERPPTPR